MKKNIFTITATCCMALFTAFLVSSCAKKESNVLAPINDHVVGKWICKDRFEKVNGEWQRVASAEGKVDKVDFRPDGTMSLVTVNAEGETMMATSTWSADEEKVTLTTFGGASQVLLLDNNNLELGTSIDTTDTATGEKMVRELKVTLSRGNDTISIAEKLVGKWNFVATEEMKNEKWVNSKRFLPDSASVVFGEDGTITTTTYYKGKEMSNTGNWSFNNKTNQVRAWKDKPDEAKTMGTISFEDDNTYLIEYPESFNPENGKLVKGPFRDRMKKETASK